MDMIETIVSQTKEAFFRIVPEQGISPFTPGSIKDLENYFFRQWWGELEKIYPAPGRDVILEVFRNLFNTLFPRPEKIDDLSIESFEPPPGNGYRLEILHYFTYAAEMAEAFDIFLDAWSEEKAA